MNPLQAGSTIGFLGAGQLARMTAHSAQRLGYKTLCWSGGADCSATEQVAGEVIDSPFTCESSKQRMLDECDVITVETENIPIHLLDFFDELNILRPSSQAVRIAGDRRLERQFIENIGLSQTRFYGATTDEDIYNAFHALGHCVAKTARDGYDGKGQWIIQDTEDVARCAAERGDQELVIEQFVNFQLEVSVIVARSTSGKMSVYDPIENIHRHHVLDTSIVPARVGRNTTARLKEVGMKVAEGLNYVGLLAVEVFVQSDGNVLINEIAPRPHNSGHFSMNACLTSQFDSHVRAICDLPLTSTQLLSPVVMLNLVSDQWHPQIHGIAHEAFDEVEKPIWHLYDKAWKPGRRKLGHVNFVHLTSDHAIEDADKLRAILTSFEGSLTELEA